jgi:hypothetical protein
MSRIYMEALAGELNKVAASPLKGAARRILKLGKRARHQARRGAGLKGRTKLSEDLAETLRRQVKPKADTMESAANLAKPPKPLTPPPVVGERPAKPMPAKDNKAIALKKTGAMLEAVWLNKIGEGPAPAPKPATTVPPANDMAQRTTGVAPPPPPLPVNAAAKAKPMPSTGPGLTPLSMGKAANAKGAGQAVKALLKDTKKDTGSYTDGQQIGVDDPRFGPGQGIKNLGSKRAVTFTSSTKGGKPGNPTENPDRFGTGGAPKASKMIPASSNAAYGTGYGRG